MLYRFFHRTHGGLFVPVGRAPSGARVSTVGAPLSKLCGKKTCLQCVLWKIKFLFWKT